MDTKYDLIIIGGGLVGASLACALIHTDLSIAIIEAKAPSSPSQTSFDERTIVLDYSSYQIFKALNVWPSLEAQGKAWPIVDIDVSELGQKGSAYLSCQDVATHALGYVVPTRVIGRILWDQLEAASNITLLCPEQADDVVCHDDRVEISLKNKTNVLSTKLMVLADGGRSSLRETLGFKITQKTYQQHLLISTITTDTPHHGRAFEKFTSHGPVALLPIQTQDYALVWTLPPKETEIYKNLEPDIFLNRLKEMYGDCAGQFKTLGARKSYPLALSYVKHPTKERVVLIGNAAHTVHPIGAQGFNLGLKDVAALAKLIASAHTEKRDIGARDLLTSYSQHRQMETRFVLYFTEFLIKVFSHQFFPIALGRRFALRALDKVQILKQMMLKRSLGLHGQQNPLRLGLPIISNRQVVAPAVSYDVMIVGAGLIGSGLAAMLACDTTLKVALIDKMPPPNMPTGDFELRINAYNLATMQLLHRAGVWDLLPKERVFPFNAVYVCNESELGSLQFAAKDVQEKHLGYFAENNLVNRVLIDHIETLQNVDYFTGVDINGIEYKHDKIMVNTQEGHQFSASLLAGCDGSNSLVRKLVGIDITCYPYFQKCIVGTLEFEGDHHCTAWQRFLSTGPIGLLPLAPGYCSLAWSCEQHYADKLMAMNEDEFIAILHKSIRGRLGPIKKMHKRACFPLIAKHANSYVAPRVALLGDAAHTIHPLAGLGANLGFQDVAKLSDIILGNGQHRTVAIGHSIMLKKYEHTRRYHNKMMMLAMSMFNATFTHDKPSLRKIAGIGLALANTIKPLKNILLKQAMWMEFGVSHRLSSIAHRKKVQ